MRHLAVKVVILENINLFFFIKPSPFSISPLLKYQTLPTKNLHSLSRNENLHFFEFSNLPITSSSFSAQARFFFNTSFWFSSTAFKAFDDMPHRGKFLQNTHFFSVFELFKLSSNRPDRITTVSSHCFALKVGALRLLPISTSFLSAYSRLGDLSSSWKLFSEIRNRDVIIWNAMITSYYVNGFHGKAVDIFLEMIIEGSGFDSTTLLLVVSALSRTNRSKHGEVIHSFSLKAGMLSDSNLCNAFIDMYSKFGNLCSAENTFLEMEFGCRDIVSWNSIMTACLHNNHPMKSLQYFRKMILFEERADGVSLSCAVSASACLQHSIHGHAIHGCGIKLGYESNSHISFANSLISLYSRHGEIKDAETIFRDMEDEDVVSWNAMLEGFVSEGKIFEAFGLLKEMLLSGSVQPDKVTLVTIIPQCAELSLLREGISIHGFTVRRLYGSDLLITNSLINLYSKCNNLTKAELLFDSILDGDIVSWNTMISGYSHNGYYKKAQILFTEVLYRDLLCSLSTVLAVFSSCSSPESLRFGKSIHSWHLKSGFSNNTLALSSLIYMYIECGDLMTAFSLLSRNSEIMDTSCWNSLISGCAQNGNFTECLEAFILMRRESNIDCDSITLVSIISACGNLGLIFQGRSIHALALKTSIGSETRVQNSLITMYGRCGDVNGANSVFRIFHNRNLCSWNCLISAYAQNKDGRRALELFRCIEFEPDEITIVSILSASTHLSGLRYGKHIHSQVFRSGLENNSIISAALMDFYSCSGRLDICLLIFQYLKEKSSASWNSMISAYGDHGEGRKAIKVFDEMCDVGNRPNKSIFTSLLSACSHSGLVNEGLWFYDNMFEEYGVRLETEHYVCVADMLGRAGEFDRVYEFIKQLGARLEPGVWGALLSACNYHGNLEMGRKIAEFLFEVEPQNVGYYVLLSNMYVAQGMWKQADEARRKIEDQGLRKPAGYSLLDNG